MPPGAYAYARYPRRATWTPRLLRRVAWGSVTESINYRGGRYEIRTIGYSAIQIVDEAEAPATD